MSGFTDIKDNEFVSEQTIFSAAYDDRNIYLGIMCEESLVDKIKTNEKKRDGDGLDESMDLG